MAQTSPRPRKGSILEVAIGLLLSGAILFSAGYYARQAAPPPARVIVLSVDGEIVPGLDAYIDRGLKEAVTTKAPGVLIEIDTPGGLVDVMLEMAKSLQNSAVPVYTYVRGSAASAGALIAMSGRKIAMAPGTAMGAAAPVSTGGQDIEGTMKEKSVSFIKAKFRAAAERLRRDGRPDLRPEIAEGMVDEDMVIPGLKEKGRLITLTAEEALDLQYCDTIADGREAVLRDFGLAGIKVREFRQMPAEGLVRFLSGPYISSFLLLIGFLGLLIEAFTPGFGAPGILGLTGLGLFFGARMLLGLTGWESVFLFIVGLVLLIVEVFVTPGFGVFGGLGLLAVGGSIVLSYSSPVQALASLSAALTAAFIMAFVLMRFLNRRGAFSPILLSTSLSTEAGFTSATDHADLLGAEGKTLTMLRPAGAVMLGGERVDVVSEGEFLPVDTAVKVVKIEGNRIVVRKITK